MLSLIFVFLSAFSWCSAAQSLVDTSAGSIQGLACNTSAATSYLAIPYALPPVGDLRFAAPLPYNSTYDGGVLNATISAPSCIQFGTVFVERDIKSEDW